MKPTTDIRVAGYQKLITPEGLAKELPMTAEANRTVVQGREAIQQIMNREDKRLAVIVGPCSIHDEGAALEYAEKLCGLAEKVQDTLLLVMRVYFEKPRTTLGWKGMINDPHMDGSCDMNTGLRKARQLLLSITEMGMPTATEFLETVTPQFVSDLICWTAIGARTTESPTHREMASGLSMPVGFKNGTDGSLAGAINAVLASRSSHSFLGLDPMGNVAVVKTNGNPYGHIVLRGGVKPNYDRISIDEARIRLIEKNLPEAVMVDCSHDNSRKKHQGQPLVWRNVIDQHMRGNDGVFGMMLESNLNEGNQKFSPDLSKLLYGVSVTDECISWNTTEELILWAHEQLLASGLSIEEKTVSANAG